MAVARLRSGRVSQVSGQAEKRQRFPRQTPARETKGNHLTEPSSNETWSVHADDDDDDDDDDEDDDEDDDDDDDDGDDEDRNGEGDHDEDNDNNDRTRGQERQDTRTMNWIKRRRGLLLPTTWLKATTNKDHADIARAHGIPFLLFPRWRTSKDEGKT